MLDAILGVIVGVLSGLVGLMGAGLTGYQILQLFGVSNVRYKAAIWATAAFGGPVAIVTFVIGYHIGATVAH